MIAGPSAAAVLADFGADVVKVEAPGGFPGLSLEDTLYSSWEELVDACRADGWVLDQSALDRPLFPAVDETSGCFLFSGTFEVEALCSYMCV